MADATTRWRRIAVTRLGGHGHRRAGHAHMLLNPQPGVVQRTDPAAGTAARCGAHPPYDMREAMDVG